MTKLEIHFFTSPCIERKHICRQVHRKAENILQYGLWRVTKCVFIYLI